MDLNKTLPYYILENLRKNPKKTALREKDYGIWQETNWEEYAAKIVRLAMYFESLGLKKGENISIIGDNKPEWVIAELAAQLLGSVPIGIYQDSVTAEVQYLLQASDSAIMVGEDQEQVDKALDILDELPRIRKIVYYDDRGMYQYDQDILIYFEDAIAAFEVDTKKVDAYLEEKIAALTLDDVAVMCTTSGTTGKPKLAMLTHRNLLFMTESLAEADPKYPEDEVRLLSAPALDGRADDVRSQRPALRLHRQLPGKRRNHAGRHEGNRPPFRLFATAGLGEHGLLGPGQDHGRFRHKALRLQRPSSNRLSLCRMQI